MMVTVPGKRSRWCFIVYGDPKHLPEWRDDGLEIYLVEYSIPPWTLAFPGAYVWCFLQDVFNFRNPWRGDGNE